MAKSELGINIDTTIDDGGLISIHTKIGPETIARQVVNTQEQAIKSALLKLGWLPPHHIPEGMISINRKLKQKSESLDDEDKRVVVLLHDIGFQQKRIAALFDVNQGRVAEAINRPLDE